MFIRIACLWMCVLFYFSFVCLHVCAYAFKFKVHCGSAFEPGVSGLPYYCTPPVCVSAVIGALAVWRPNNKKKKRVLHPNIQEHQTVDILRGLPEGSCLSPTLFGIFVADSGLIHELQTKFPHAVINLAPGLQDNGTTQIWIGGLPYVDDLALMSTFPCELQAMLHVCQEWSVRNRMQINTQKTKVIAFFETASLQKARGGQHQHGPTLPPFHIHAPFQTSSPCSYLITVAEVLQFE